VACFDHFEPIQRLDSRLRGNDVSAARPLYNSHTFLSFDMTDPAIFEPAARGSLDASVAVTECIEGACRLLLLDEESLSGDFFDLSTGVLGNALQRATNYGIRMAVVVRNPERHSGPFQEFLREAAGGAAFGSFPARQDAIAWLSRE
jgi:hypothetical protein